uniref:Uncharacterized protein n=1 Tax=Arundo donax TaxID=35708 RepID=A0A0A8XZ91_ARUDO
MAGPRRVTINFLRRYIFLSFKMVYLTDTKHV